MYCRNCGKKLSDVAKFCPYCGTQVISISTNIVDDKKSGEPEVPREIKVEPEPEVTYETKAEPEPEVMYEAKAEPEPEVAYETKTEPEPEITHEAKTGPEPTYEQPDGEKTSLRDISEMLGIGFVLSIAYSGIVALRSLLFFINNVFFYGMPLNGMGWFCNAACSIGILAILAMLLVKIKKKEKDIKNLFFILAILCVVMSVFGLIQLIAYFFSMFSYGYYTFSFTNLLANVLAFLMTTVSWMLIAVFIYCLLEFSGNQLNLVLKRPEKNHENTKRPNINYQNVEDNLHHSDINTQSGKSAVPLKTDRSLLFYIVLSIFTCGIYSYYFIYSIARDVNEACRGDYKNTGGLLKFIVLSILTCGIYGIWWEYNLGNRLAENALRYGCSFSENGTTVLLWYVFGMFICGIGPFIAMNILIKNTNIICRLYNQKNGLM